MTALQKGDAIPELSVTPDAGLTKRYAEASGDPNPIHTDPEFAKSAGLPGCILHGLWTMAQVARASEALAGGDPRALKRLEVQFRGMGFPEQEVTVRGTVTDAGDGRIVIDTVAEQGGNQIIRNAHAELAV
jgi:acyl dehydratase